METKSQGKSENGGRQGQAPQGRMTPHEELPESQAGDGGRGASQQPERTEGGRSIRPRRGGEQWPSLWRGNPFETMARLSQQMDQLAESFFGRRFAFPSWFGSTGPGEGRMRGLEQGLWTPSVDVRQSGDALVISAELPGVKRDEVRIEATEDGIAISGERQEAREEGGRDRGYQLVERSYGSFYRNIPLPEGAEVDAAKASIRDGVLEIRVPVKPGKTRRQIEITD